MSTGQMARGLFAQAFVAAVVGIIAGSLLAWLSRFVIPDTVPVLFRRETFVLVAVLAIASALIGAAFSLRRIAKIDPATALGGAL